jgi:hypothetical protein
MAAQHRSNRVLRLLLFGMSDTPFRVQDCCDLADVIADCLGPPMLSGKDDAVMRDVMRLS